MKKKRLLLSILGILIILLNACGKESDPTAISINVDDVKTALMEAAPYLAAIGVILVIMIVILVTAPKIAAGKKKLIRVHAIAGGILAVVLCLNLVCVGPMFSLLNLVFGQKASLSPESLETGAKLAREVADEGIVLLKNDGDLPLKDSVKNLNVFGWASVDPVYGGTGSGQVNTATATTLLQGLESGGYQINNELVQFYTDYHVGRPLGSWTDEQDWTLSEPTPEQYGDTLLENARNFSDTAVIVIGRVGGENKDLPKDLTAPLNSYNSTDPGMGHPGDFDAGEHFLKLSGTEEKLVEMVCGEYSNVVVIINSANPMELGWVENYKQIGGVLWCAGPGETGFQSLGGILNGSVNPSGRLADTFPYDFTSSPTWHNYGDLSYENAAEFMPADMPATFVNYVEGIYVGYKFYETAHAEGLIDYDKTVQYPFGYGLSYTDFQQEITDFNADGNTVTVNVLVTNTGALPGKEVVELYYTPPYTNGGIEKSAVNLIEFGKTDLLEPGASETITLSFDYESIASFDDKENGCYVLEKGDYEVSIRSDAHSILDSKKFAVNNDIIYHEDYDGKRPSDQVTATALFEDVAGQGITYLSRTDGFANYQQATAKPVMTLPEKYWEMAGFNFNPDATVYNNPEDVMPVMNAENGLKIEELRGLDYEDPKWELLLDQLSFREMNSLIGYGGYATSAVYSIGLPATIECDAPQAIYSNYVKGLHGTALPSAAMIGCTWNQELVEKCGEMMGIQADELNVSGWYAPAMNIHRSPFSGRNFEYFSEDGILSGKLAAAEIRGANKYGLITYMKHFVLNDQEANRMEVMTWTEEQALREIYMKPFEISVKEGKSMGCMTSFNFIGAEWAGSSYRLCTDVLREEWGFQGLVITDWLRPLPYHDSDMIIRSGSDKMLVMNGNRVDDTSATSTIAMRKATHNILFTLVNTRTGEHLENRINDWVIAMICIDVLLVLGAAAIEFGAIRKHKRNGNIHIE